MRTLSSIVGLLFAAVAIIGVIFVGGMRRKTPIVLDAVRRSGRATKPLVLRSAGGPSSPTAVVEHVGRASRRAYETPVLAAPVEGGFVIALPYGQNTDWLKNVLAEGRATIRLGGRSHEVEGPEVVPLDDVEDSFAAKERRRHRQFGVREALVVRATDHGAVLSY